MTDLAARQPNWLERLSPDFSATLARFPLAIALALLGALAFVGSINGFLPDIIPQADLRLVFGLWTAAVLAVAGQLFRESRAGTGLTGITVGFGVPLLGLAAFFITDTRWIVPYLLPAASLLWLSVSAFTRVGQDTEREEAQNRFWWMNQRAITTATLAALAFLILAVGALVIQLSLSQLFGFDLTELFYQYLLPFVASFLVPVYWLATIPRLGDYDVAQLREPDFVARAIGFLGQFLLVPLVLAYSLILLSYAAQIVVTWSLPQGVLGWMVLGFAVTGAAAWLVLHPPFMRERLLVRVFRRWWFWLTIIPLGLFSLALWVRVDAYGLTIERVLLLVGGLWAAALTVVFLIRRGDIRLVPGLAAALLLVFSIGPWNLENLPRWTQMARFNQALLLAGAEDSGGLRWTPELAADARSALDYLRYNDPNPRLDDIVALLDEYRIEVTRTELGEVEAVLGIVDPGAATTPSAGYRVFLRDERGLAVSLVETPVYVGLVSVWQGGGGTLAAFDFWIEEGALNVRETGVPEGEIISVSLSEWVARQEDNRISSPALAFQWQGLRYRLVVTDATAEAPGQDGPWTVTTLSGILFSDAVASAE